MAMVVNHFVPGGWLEHLTLLKLREAKFSEELGQGEVSRDAAAEVIKAAQERSTTQASGLPSAKLQEPISTEKSHKLSSASDSKVHNAELPVATEASTAAGDGASALQPWIASSSVWDSSRSMKTSNAKLRFDPRPPGISDDWFERLQSMPGRVEPPPGCPHDPQVCVFLSRTNTKKVCFFHRSGIFLQKSLEETDHEYGSVLKMWEGHVFCQPDTVICQCIQASQTRHGSYNGYWPEFSSDPWEIAPSDSFSYTLDNLKEMSGGRDASLFFGRGRAIPTGELSELGFNPENQWFWESWGE